MTKEINRKRYVLGIDPGTGSSSACGLALYDRQENKLIKTEALWADKGHNKPTYKRIANIASKVLYNAILICDEYGDDNVEFHIEWFIMRGKGGETLQRFIGTVMSHISHLGPIKEVHNIKLKKALTGHQKADKMEMGTGLLKNIPMSRQLIEELIDDGRWDEIDAACIAWCEDER